MRPRPSEAPNYFFTYIDRVGEGEIVELLRQQLDTAGIFFRSIEEDRSTHRYAPDKWSISQVLQHINDCERLLVFRAMWFARGLPGPLPDFDQVAAAAAAAADARPWSSHIDEFETVRAGSLAFFESLSDEAWERSGEASSGSFSVRGLAYCTAGHVTHHIRMLQERYGVSV